MKKIVICGGHLTPALALIESLEKTKDIQIIFFGRKFATEGNKNTSAEYKILSDKKIKFVKLTAGRLQRKFTSHTLSSLLKIPVGFFQSFLNLLLIHPNLVVSFGGYLSTPTVFGAWLLGIDCVCHEQATIPGLASRINSLFAKKVFLTWPGSQKYFDIKKTEVIGNLTRKSLLDGKPTDAKITAFFRRNKKVIFITGGNQGSHFINSKVGELQKKLKGFSIIHQVGTANFKGDFDKAKQIKNTHYLALDYLDSPGIGYVFKNSKIMLCRSGANTVWDLAVFAKVALFIPLPISAYGEQMENAKILENALSAKVITQDQATPQNIASTIQAIDKNLSQLEQNAQNFAKILPKDAVLKITNYILQ